MHFRTVHGSVRRIFSESRIRSWTVSYTHLEEITRTVRDQFEAAGFETLTLSTESCAICKKCAYPDAPCRHPDKMFPCVESYGILVTNMAEQCGIEFIEGGNVVVWFSLVLLRERCV